MFSIIIPRWSKVSPFAAAGCLIATSVAQVTRLFKPKMTNPLHTAFSAIVRAEVLINSKRVAPYALFLLFAAHSVLWWGWSAASSFGWASNSDFNIVRNLQGFSFLLGLPIFNAVIMSDAVIRDFRTGIDPLLLSKPIGRISYLSAKFSANFFVLVCCQSGFVLTMLLLQFVPLARLLVQPIKVFPYFKHFFFFVVVSHLLLSAVYFMIGTLTRNAKFAYAAAVAFYPLYIAYQVLILKNLPARWAALLDPMLFNAADIPRARWVDAAWVNQIVVNYSTDMIVNRAFIVVIALTCLVFVCLRFRFTEPERSAETFVGLNISNERESVYSGEESLVSDTASPFRADIDHPRPVVPVPAVALMNAGAKANFRKLCATTVLELYLLRFEKSLIVLVPLSMLLSFLALPFSNDVAGTNHSAIFAANTAQGLLLFLIGVTVFYIGEAMHRDRETKIEAILWSAPAPNNVFLLSKFAATVVLLFLLVVLIGLVSVITQLLRGQAPIELSSYLIAYALILVPGLAFAAAATIAVNVVVRERYLAYAIIIAAGAAFFYLYSQGHNHWVYNPVLYGLWSSADLLAPSRLLFLRLYCFALTILCLLIAHLLYERKPTIICRRYSV